MQKTNEYFNQALKLIEKTHTHEELLNYLKTGTVIERQYAALTIEKINSKEEAHILMSNLTGVDGKIREAAALKISNMTKIYPQYFQEEINYKIFSDATIDIDGNVCRLAISAAENIISDTKFATYYANSLIEIINTALAEISKFTFRDKKYKINKQIFKIYWCLEALIKFHSHTNVEKIKKILKQCSDLSEYTIREKCAKLVKIMPPDEEIEQIKSILSKDENYYVRNIFE